MLVSDKPTLSYYSVQGKLQPQNYKVSNKINQISLEQIKILYWRNFHTSFR